MIRLIASLFATMIALAASAQAEHDHIRIDLKRGWDFSTYTASKVELATHFSISMAGEFAKFACNDAGKRAMFIYDWYLPIEMTEHPLLVLKYRAKNLDVTSDKTCVWIIEGANHAYFP